jgi:hypothetical protein
MLEFVDVAPETHCRKFAENLEGEKPGSVEVQNPRFVGKERSLRVGKWGIYD